MLAKFYGNVDKKIWRLISNKNIKGKDKFNIVTGKTEFRLVSWNFIKQYFFENKGENCYKLHSWIRDNFAGVSKHVIQEWINSEQKHCESHPIFENKDPLQAVIVKSLMDACQIDLAIVEKHPSKVYNNKTFFYILNVMDVFSRYIFLKPPQSKESLEVASYLREILFSVGIPNVIQCDRSSESKVDIFKFVVIFIIFLFNFTWKIC